MATIGLTDENFEKTGSALEQVISQAKSLDMAKVHEDAKQQGSKDPA